MSKSDKFVLPGDVIGAVGDVALGPGTYASGGKVRASVCGLARRRPAAAAWPGSDEVHAGAREAVEVASTKSRSTEVVPSIGASVVARVSRIAPRQAMLEILSVNGHVARIPFLGVIRKVDTREFEVDRVAMHDCYLPGDVVRAEVLSLGDSKAYFLTTARDDLGVVHAVSSAGEPMVPRSWEEMQCPVTKQCEKRKVARLDAAAGEPSGGEDK